jgi:hypothetical protein
MNGAIACSAVGNTCWLLTAKMTERETYFAYGCLWKLYEIH